MRIGIVADTHNRVLPSLFDALAGVEEILHAGDVCRPDVLAEIEAIAPVIAVHGNCDEWELVDRLPAERRIERGGVAIAIVHGHQVGRASPERVAKLYGTGQPPGAVPPQPSVVIFGHSHQPCDARIGSMRLFNPGTAGGVRYSPSVGILTIVEGRFELEHVPLAR